MKDSHVQNSDIRIQICVYTLSKLLHIYCKYFRESIVLYIYIYIYTILIRIRIIKIRERKAKMLSLKNVTKRTGSEKSVTQLARNKK
jgi:hypothetical protein